MIEKFCGPVRDGIQRAVALMPRLLMLRRSHAVISRFSVELLTVVLLAGLLGIATPALASQAADQASAARDAGDYGRALKLSSDACAKADQDACSVLAVLHFFGQGTAKKPDVAVALAEPSCTAGMLRGCNLLGLAYEFGAGKPKDMSKAFSLFKQACIGGFDRACPNFGSQFLGLPKTTDPDALVAAKRNQAICFAKQSSNDAPSCAVAGGLYARIPEPAGGMSKMWPVAERGCALDDKTSCTFKGILLMTGEGVAKNYDAARPLLEKECNRDSGFACKQLGDLIFLMSLNRANGLSAYEKACALGFAEGCLAAKETKQVWADKLPIAEPQVKAPMPTATVAVARNPVSDQGKIQAEREQAGAPFIADGITSMPKLDPQLRFKWQQWASHMNLVDYYYDVFGGWPAYAENLGKECAKAGGDLFPNLASMPKWMAYSFAQSCYWSLSWSSAPKEQIAKMFGSMNCAGLPRVQIALIAGYKLVQGELGKKPGEPGALVSPIDREFAVNNLAALDKMIRFLSKRIEEATNNKDSGAQQQMMCRQQS